MNVSKEIFKKQLLMLNKNEENFLFSLKYGIEHSTSEQQLIECLSLIHKEFPNDLEIFKQLLTRENKTGINFVEYFQSFQGQIWSQYGLNNFLINWIHKTFDENSFNIIFSN